MPDLYYGARMLLKKPGFTLIAIITLSLGIGACTAIFSVVDAVLLRALPYPDADRLVFLREVSATGGTMAMAEANFDDLQARSNSFSALAYTGGGNLVVTGGSEPVRARVSYASGRFCDVLGVQPFAGRTFLDEETKYGGPAAVMISYGFWQRLLGGRPDFSAASLNVDGARCNVVGIMPPGFGYPAETEVWVTRGIEPPITSRTAHNWPVIGRLRSGVTLAQARAEVSGIARQLRQEFGAGTDAVDFALVPLQEYLTRNVRDGLRLLLGAVAMLLLVACANVSNLLLAQFIARQREFTVRAALGASRWRLTRQLIVENLLLTLPAAAVGALLASYGVRLVAMLDQGNLPRMNDIGVNGRVLFFACGLAVVIAGSLGLLPALRFARQDLQAGLKEAGRGQSADSTSQRLRGGLAVAQIAIATVLLAGALLLGRSFVKLLQIDPGFRPESAVAMTLSLPSTVTPQEDERLRQFYVQLLERLGQLPGVTAVGGINVLPLADRGANGMFLIDNDPAQRGHAEYRVASAGYFAAIGMRLLHGRLFDASDTVNSPHVAVVSQSLAQRYWPNGDALGKRIQFGNMDTDKRLMEVVGVVSDVHDAGLDIDARPTVYGYSVQRPQWWQVSRLSIVTRAATDPTSLQPAMRAAVQVLRPDVPLSFRTLEQVFSSSLDQRRFSLVLFGVFAIVALLIAAIGIYGVIAHAVTQRTQELGIRIALGAQAKDIMKMVLGQGMKLALMGTAFGLLASFAATRLMKGLLFGVGAADPMTFVLISVLLILATLLASYIPARRATKVDPIIALRYE